MSARAQRDLDRVPERIVPAVVEFVFGDLAEAPERVGKPLQRELTGMRSARRGPYRILYVIEGASKTIDVMRIAHRSDVYH